MAKQKARENPPRRLEARQILGMVALVVLAVFALLNSQTVKVQLLVRTVRWPLIFVIAVSGLLGAAIGWLGHKRHERAP